MNDFVQAHPGPLDVIYEAADTVLRNAEGLLGADKLADFFATVRWNEPFILALVLGQIFLFMLTYATRRFEIAQFCILMVITMITLAAERLNMYGKRHWSQFASQNYFDGPGLFMMIFVSGPFVVLANVIVIGMGLKLVHLYSRRVRIQHQQREEEEEATVAAEHKKNT
ncbi:unnamed protein product [Chondrus crispus]|uniref:Uncharacterized protein n=1 Tax=Chondrus crispus TaxID=2769 RepID=R7QGC7_CHOCR|nr:unnamed protein product [Chondrus crispus]CDF36465.1 unnamed protein product [Chondrus crispus]|eukprot:XP_005716284.1 unnamed protein product [Chondrus crispus]